MLDAARSDGVDVTLDTYPYLPGSTTLAALLPSWFAAGGPDALLARLAGGHDRDALAESFEAGADGFHGEHADWSLIEIAGVASAGLEHYVGSTIAQIAEAEHRDPLQVITDILVEDELATSVLMHIGHEHNVQAVMRDSGHCGGSDGILVGTKPHPRAWGTFPRYLARYVRELGILSLEECVRHLAGTPARRLSLHDRGLIREGFAADLVLFDEKTVQDTATFDHPRQQATGIDVVLVNGSVAYENGRTTDARSGTALRSHAQYSKAE
jgi:N-acyl-D-amino-acid deacylase